MYLLSEPRGGRRPATSGRPETLEIMCNLIFAQNKRGEDGRREGGRQRHKRGQKNGRLSRTGPVPKGSRAFSSQATQSHRALCLIPLTPLTLVLMVFWPGTVDAEKRLCRSSCVSLTPSFSLSHTLLVSLLLTPLSFLSPFSVHRRPPPSPLHIHTHTPSLFSIHSFSHYWSVSALENCCACRAGVITSGINHFPCA